MSGNIAGLFLILIAILLLYYSLKDADPSHPKFRHHGLLGGVPSNPVEPEDNPYDREDADEEDAEYANDRDAEDAEYTQGAEYAEGVEGGRDFDFCVKAVQAAINIYV